MTAEGDDSSDDWQVVYRGYDSTQLTVIEGLLSSMSIPARRLGRANPSLLGVGDTAILQLISVPADLASDAREAIAEFDGHVVAPDEETAEPSVAASDAWKVRLKAIGMSVLCPGLGLAYAGALWPGLALAVWSFTAIALSRGSYDFSVAGALFGYGVARLVDAAASQVLLTLHNGRATLPVVPQLMAAFVLVSVMHWSVHLLGVPAMTRLLPGQRTAPPTSCAPLTGQTSRPRHRCGSESTTRFQSPERKWPVSGPQ